jgi:hypothetical protein
MFLTKYLTPIALFGLGAAIFFSSTGKVPRMAIAFGEDRHLVGLTMMLVAAFFAYLIHRQSPPSDKQ